MPFTKMMMMMDNDDFTPGTIPGTGRKGLMTPRKTYSPWHSVSSIQGLTRYNPTSLYIDKTKQTRSGVIRWKAQHKGGARRKQLETPSKSQIVGTVKYLIREKKQKQNLQICVIRNSLKMRWVRAGGGGGVRNGTRRLEV